MNIKELHTLEKLKGVKPRDVVYPGIMAVFIMVVIVIFSLATSSISRNINKVFSAEVSEVTQALDLPRYTLVAKKLGFSAPGTQGVTTPEAPTPTQEAALASTPITAPTLNKKDISITVLNSTGKKGIAGALAKVIGDAGFSTPTTGNEKTSYAITTILVKKSKYDYASLLLETVLTAYPDAVATTTSDTAAFDATVIIGGK